LGGEGLARRTVLRSAALAVPVVRGTCKRGSKSQSHVNGMAASGPFRLPCRRPHPSRSGCLSVMPIEATLTGLQSTWSHVLSSSTIIGKFTLIARHVLAERLLRLQRQGPQLHPGSRREVRQISCFGRPQQRWPTRSRAKFSRTIISFRSSARCSAGVWHTRRRGQVAEGVSYDHHPLCLPVGLRVNACSYSLAQRRKEWE
jgi:hypothetical protein